MFKNLLTLLRKGDLVDQAIEEADRMFNNAHKLFREVIDVLKERRQPKFDIYKLDRKINSKEKSIRRKILENMAYNPRQDIVASLVLTSIIIDVERIGDYSKNIFELTGMCSVKEKCEFDKELLEKADAIEDYFTKVGDALSSGDENTAKGLMETLDPIKKGFDEYIDKLYASTDCNIKSAVTNVMLARFLKRVAAHLSNITSSIANPFDMIGFFPDEPDREAD